MNRIKNIHWFCDNCNQDNIVHELKEFRDFRIQHSKLSERLEQLEVKTERNGTQLRELQETINNSPAAVVNVQKDEILEIIREDRDINARKLNLCIFNLPSSDNDQMCFSRICTDKLGIPADFLHTGILSTNRIKTSNETRPGITIVSLQSLDVKRMILRKASNFRNYTPDNSNLKIFIAPDLTRKQREEQKKLREELNLRRNNGEQVTIHNGQVIQ